MRSSAAAGERAAVEQQWHRLNPPCVAARLGCLLSCAFHNGGGNVHELTDAKNEKRLLRFQKRMASYELLIVDELGSCHYRTQASNCSSRSSATSGD